MCGHIWFPQAGNLLYGYGCPNCNHGSTSFVEQYIYNTFVAIFGEEGVVSRDKKSVGKELDVFIPSLNKAVEFGSWHWHKDNLKKDKIKKTLCKEKGIELITILDNCPEGFNDDDFWCYTQKIERDKEILLQLIKRLLLSFGLGEDYNRLDFETIYIDAVNQSRKRSTDEFVEQIKEINPDVVVVGEYINNSSGIKTECRKCGHIWYPRAGNLLNGSRCPKCYGHVRMTQEEFEAKLLLIHPSLLVKDKYKNMTTPLTILCKTCNTEFSVKPNTVLRNYGCPTCYSNDYLNNLSNKRINRLKERRPDISILSECYDADGQIICKCEKCGYN